MLDRNTLKDKFVTGARPSEEDYHAIFDSFVHKEEDANSLGLRLFSNAQIYPTGSVALFQNGSSYLLRRANKGTGPGFVNEDWDLIPLETFVPDGTITFSKLNSSLIPTSIGLGEATKLASTEAVKNFVEEMVSSFSSGFSWKLSARAVVGNGEALSGTYTTADGVALAIGDRVIRNATSTPTLNGIYVVSSGAWSRSEDANTGEKLKGATVIVDEGTAFGDSIFFVTTNGEIELGVHPITWSRISSNVLSAGTGIQISGNVIGVNEAAVQMRVVTPGVYVPGTLNMDVVFQSASSSVGTPLNFSVSSLSNGGIGKSVYIRLSSANTGDSFGVSVAGFTIEMAGFGFRGGVLNEVYVSQVTASVLRVTINPVV